MASRIRVDGEFDWEAGLFLAAQLELAAGNEGGYDDLRGFLIRTVHGAAGPVEVHREPTCVVVVPSTAQSAASNARLLGWLLVQVDEWSDAEHLEVDVHLVSLRSDQGVPLGGSEF